MMSTAEQEIVERSKQHGPYKLKDGTRVPGVTEITGILDKGPRFRDWINQIGLQGIKLDKYVDALADVGTLAHDMILADLSGESVASAASRADPATRDLAENCYLSFCAWRKQHDIRPISLEQSLVSEKYRYGGRADMVAEIDGVLELVDFKTGKGIYREMFYQLAGYAPLLLENRVVNRPIERARILNIPRAETEMFLEKAKSSLLVEWQIFQKCLDIYNLVKEIEK
ncbi:MAG: hypothetical protein NTV82_01120 [Candidatus Aminicenantes bacterium]|nr:hypothetical protein [Candidatus Aminicenantes bacterium]